ncbi:DUF2878 domain-containing protein [Gallaecimonas pentaromativorans]|uniref:Uncharacterized protein DUF2878 n=1 Tax=Gallaecimonas pentaromativorans TaxID=584787 RepID=A0A3N1PI04_9GAMM|nr:DUF2878 domain-containing protein [Gallaecimonas pentaromativorans]ROQ27448.1 uncharacterized protein DUF2878 [Gallaecimonas pentaromativorans]
MHWLLNLLLYQGAWLVAVLAKSAWPVLAILALHLWLSNQRRADSRLMLLYMFIGALVDGSLSLLGLFDFGPGVYLVPLWLVALWAALAMLPNHSLAWLKGRLWLNVLLGALAGPLAYWGGVRLGAAQFGWPLMPAIATLALVWAGLWPGLMALAKREAV